MNIPAPYFSPLLPVVIAEPGCYVTRKGELVDITRTGNGRGPYTCLGRYPDSTPESWHKSGRLWCGRECDNDIVAPAPQYRREFRDFGTLDVELPPGFVDESWHNDAMPMFTRGNLRLSIDYADKSKSEMPEECERFMVTDMELAHGCFPGDLLLATDDWAAMLAFLAARA